MRKLVLVSVWVLFATSYSIAQIPTAEREALIALHNSTDGSNWLNDTNWLGDEGTECTWHGVTCFDGHVQTLVLYGNQLNGSIPPELGNLSGLTGLYLYSNQLTGSIPAELGNLSSLVWLSLFENQLSGSIPPELGNLAGLTSLALYSNQLTGSIPAELENLSGLRYLYLYSNQLSGSIPAELGNMSSLKYLRLNSNQLSGSIPVELENLSKLEWLSLFENQLSGGIPPELGNLSGLVYLYLNSNQLSGSIPTGLGGLSNLLYLDLRWNALHSDDAALIEFLDGKQIGGDWQITQTLAPDNLTVDSVGDHSVWLRWDAVGYQEDPGGYEVFFATTGSDVWTSGGWTDAKTDSTFPVTVLDPAAPYDFVVVSYTDPHVNNPNLVISEFSPEVMATTANVGCAQPSIQIAWGDPITLSLAGTYDTYLWNTGETIPSIVVDPQHEQWYWVTVTGPGSCEETAATVVVPQDEIFADSFESGNTSEWSTAVP